MVRKSKVNQIILIILDDLRAEHLFGLISKGRLPNIAQIANNGIKCSNCITSYPSITFPCYSNIITGAYSGYFPKEGSAVPLYHWVNRNDPPSESKKLPYIRNYGDRSQTLKINRDIGKNVKTIFEQAPQRNNLSSSCFLFRGAYFLAGKSVFDVEGIFKNISEAFNYPKKFFPDNEIPSISVGYVFQTDDIVHKKGYNNPEYINLLIDCDKYIGSLIDVLKKTGYYDSTAIGIISDHGNFKAKRYFDLEPFFQQIGLRPYIPDKGTGDFDCNFGSVGFFNFPGDSWHNHPTNQQLRNFKVSGSGKTNLNLIEILWKIPGVNFMYYREDNNKPEKGSINIEYREKKKGKISKGIIEFEGFGQQQKTKYLFNEKEFYGYNEKEKSIKILDSKFHTIEEWGEATNNSEFPMIIDQIPRYFKNPRSCDIMISTLGDYNFNYEHGKTTSSSLYSHDNGLKESMIVPFIIGGSLDIPELELEYCKTTDMIPTLLDLLGFNPHSSVIGRTLLN